MGGVKIKRLFKRLGIFYIILIILLSSFFVTMFILTKSSDIEVKEIFSEPKPDVPKKDDYILSARNLTFEEKLNIFLVELDNYYQRMINQTRLYHEAVRDRDHRAHTYLLYMVILDGILAFLTLASFLALHMTSKHIPESI